MKGVAVVTSIMAMATALFSGPAAADGMYRERAYGAPAPINWSGLYVGVHAGGAWSDLDLTYDNGPPPGTPHTLRGDSFMGGIQGGYMHQFGNIVAGVEVSYSKLSLDDRSPFPAPFATSSVTSSINDLFTATGRLGVVFDRSLIYAKGGYASADVDFAVFTAGTLSGTINDREHGWTVGGGWEYALTKNVIFGVEYKYVHLNIDNHDFALVPGFGPCGVPTCRIYDVDADIHTVTARLSWKFDRDNRVPLK